MIFYVQTVNVMIAVIECQVLILKNIECTLLKALSTGLLSSFLRRNRRVTTKSLRSKELPRKNIERRTKLQSEN